MFEDLWQRPDVWIVIGLAGQLLFSARFLVSGSRRRTKRESVGSLIYTRNLAMIRRRKPQQES